MRKGFLNSSGRKEAPAGDVAAAQDSPNGPVDGDAPLPSGAGESSPNPLPADSGASTNGGSPIRSDCAQNGDTPTRSKAKWVAKRTDWRQGGENTQVEQTNGKSSPAKCESSSHSETAETAKNLSQSDGLSVPTIADSKPLSVLSVTSSEPEREGADAAAVMINGSSKVANSSTSDTLGGLLATAAEGNVSTQLEGSLVTCAISGSCPTSLSTKTALPAQQGEIPMAENSTAKNTEKQDAVTSSACIDVDQRQRTKMANLLGNNDDNNAETIKQQNREFTSSPENVCDAKRDTSFALSETPPQQSVAVVHGRNKPENVPEKPSAVPVLQKCNTGTESATTTPEKDVNNLQVEAKEQNASDAQAVEMKGKTDAVKDAVKNAISKPVNDSEKTLLKKEQAGNTEASVKTQQGGNDTIRDEGKALKDADVTSISEKCRSPNGEEATKSVKAAGENSPPRNSGKAEKDASSIKGTLVKKNDDTPKEKRAESAKDKKPEDVSKEQRGDSSAQKRADGTTLTQPTATESPGPVKSMTESTRIRSPEASPPPKSKGGDDGKAKAKEESVEADASGAKKQIADDRQGTSANLQTADTKTTTPDMNKSSPTKGVADAETSPPKRELPPPPILPTPILSAAPGTHAVMVTWPTLQIPGMNFIYQLVIAEKAPPGVTLPSPFTRTIALYGGDSQQVCTVLVEGLSPGRMYNMHLMTHTEEYGDLFSEKAMFATAPGQPERPDAPVVTGKTKSSVKLRLTPPYAGGSPLTGYEVEMRLAVSSNGMYTINGVELPGAQVRGEVVYQGAENKCEIKGLRPGTMHEVRVRAANMLGMSEPSAWHAFTTSAAAPAAPPIPYVASLGLDWMAVAWSAPEDNGGSEVSNYTLEVEGCGDEEGFMVRYNGAQQCYTHTKAVPGRKYRFRVKAANAVGTSPFSPILEAKACCGPPSQPGPVVLAGKPRPTSLQIRWAAPQSDNGSPIQMYQVAMRMVVDGVPQGVFEVCHNGEAAFCELRNLRPATNYEIAVVAISALGASAPCTPTLHCTAATVPSPPSAPYLLANTKNAIHVQWNAPEQCNGAPIVAYRLEALAADGSNPVLLYEGRDAAYVVQGLEPGSHVCLRVVAANAHGHSQPSSMAVLGTACAVPSAPSGLALVRPATRNSAELRWNPPTSTGGLPITGYRVQVWPASEKHPGEKHTWSVGGVTHAVDQLVAGCQYKARVQAGNQQGYGDFTPALVFSTESAQPDAPAPPTAEETAAGCVALSWAPPETTRGAAVTHYALQMHDGQQYTIIYEGPLTAFEVQGLQPGATYRFRVRASNAAGDGPYSSAVAVATAAVVSGPPLGLTATGVSSNGIKLKWGPPAFTGGSNPHAYAVLVREVDRSDAAAGAAAGDEDAAERREVWNGPATSCRIKANPDTAYEIVVVAYNSVGQSPASAPAHVTTPGAAPAESKAAAQPRPPGPMAAPSVSARTANSATVTWAAVKEPGSGACRQYHLQVDSGAGEPTTCYRGAATTYQLQGLSPGGSYAVRVCAENEAGLGQWSQYTKFATKAANEVRNRRLAAPEGLTLEKATKASLRLRWRSGGGGDGSDAPAAEGAAAAAAPTFRVELAEGSGSFEAVYTGSATEYTARGLRPDCRYRVRVQAVGRAGPGPYGPVESYRTLPAGRSLLWEVACEAHTQLAVAMLLVVIFLLYLLM